jgi:hypothetical protein
MEALIAYDQSMILLMFNQSLVPAEGAPVTGYYEQNLIALT